DIETVALTFWAFLHGTVTLLLRQRLRLHSAKTDKQITSQVIEYFFNTLTNGNDQKKHGSGQSRRKKRLSR
ncbi:MAG: hypothetical protein V3T31_11710, partial [candidate division Zixibacteria bacterium]